MPAILVSAYEKGAQVDLDYYINKHMPKAFSLFQPHCKSWRVVTATRTTDPFEVMTFAEYAEAEDIWATFAAESFKPVAQWIEEDMANYSQKKPISWVMEENGTGPS